MDNNKQRIKIAEACGYTHVRIIKAIEGPPDIGIGHHPTEPYSVPDYLNDLNAMHRALKLIGEIKGIELCWHLNDMGISGDWQILTATAEELAEAFLKTLNLWEE
jgi:hypothetical protein